MNTVLSLINGTTANGTEKPFTGTSDYPPAVEAFLTSLYVIIGIAGLSLNGIVCYLFVKDKVKKTSFNLLLLILSVSDMASIIFISPYVFVDLRDLDTSQNTLNYLCGITIGVTPYWMCTFVSVFILSLISVNRYFLVNHPTRVLWLRKEQTVWICLGFFWVISLCIGTPNIFAFRYDKATGICYRNWPPGFNAVAYTFSTTIIGMIIPISFMMYTFIATARTLWGRKSSSGTDSAVLKARKRVVSLLGILILVYFICSLPSVVYWIMSRGADYFPEGVEGEYLRIKIIRIVVLSALSNTIMDPLIYALRSHEFKKAFKGLFPYKSKEDRPKALNSRSQASSRNQSCDDTIL